MIIPTFQNALYVEKNGYLTSQMQLYNDELNTVLRNGLSDNGWTIPQVTQQQLTDIANLPADQQMPNGTMWVVTDLSPQELVIKLDGALRKVTTTAYP